MTGENLTNAAIRIYGVSEGSGSSNKTKKAKQANGMAKIATNKLTQKQKEKLIDWMESDKKTMSVQVQDSSLDTAQQDSMNVQVNETSLDTAQQDSMNVQVNETVHRATKRESQNKTKNKAIRGVGAELVHIYTPEGIRKVVWLEPDFYEALQVVARDNQKQWLTSVLVDAWGNEPQEKGQEKANLASAVRSAIVRELLKNVVLLQQKLIELNLKLD